MSIFVLKIIACIAMILDHIKYAIPETRCFFTIYLGRIAFPLFAFLAGEGYCHTRNLKKYYQRLLLFAIFSQIPFMLFRSLVGDWKMLNILFTLLLGLLCITAFDKFGKKYYFSLPIVIFFIFMGKVLNVDYGWYGVLTVFVLYMFRNHKILRIIALVMVNLIYYYPVLVENHGAHYFISYFFATFPAILLLCYNGKLGRKTKYGYYIFYPLHMLLFYFIGYL